MLFTIWRKSSTDFGLIPLSPAKSVKPAASISIATAMAPASSATLILFMTSFTLQGFIVGMPMPSFALIATIPES